MIPDPRRYNPIQVTITTSENDTLDYKAKTISTATGLFLDHTLLEIKKGGSSTISMNIVEDTKRRRHKSRMHLAEWKGLKYPFKKGEIYRVHSKFQSELQGTVEVDNSSFRLWHGEVSCDDVLEFRYD